MRLRSIFRSSAAATIVTIILLLLWDSRPSGAEKLRETESSLANAAIHALDGADPVSVEFKLASLRNLQAQVEIYRTEANFIERVRRQEFNRLAIIPTGTFLVALISGIMLRRNIGNVSA